MDLNKIIAVMLGVFLVGCDGQPSTQTWPLMQPEHSYEVVSWGINPYLVEFTPKHNPGYSCILAVSVGGRPMSIFCMPKGGNSGT